MLSIKYHASYWAVSAVSAALYHALTEKLGLDEANFKLALGPLIIYAIYLLWRGPYQDPRPLRLDAGCLAFIGCLSVSLGSVAGDFWLPCPNFKPAKGLIHTILSFSALGMLEPIRQNRNDIELISMMYLIGYPRIEFYQPWRSHTLGYLSCHMGFYAIYMAIISVIDFGLRYAYSPQVSCWSIAEGHRQDICSHFGSALILIFLAIPFSDMAETVRHSKAPFKNEGCLAANLFISCSIRFFAVPFQNGFPTQGHLLPYNAVGGVHFNITRLRPHYFCGYFSLSSGLDHQAQRAHPGERVQEACQVSSFRVAANALDDTQDAMFPRHLGRLTVLEALLQEDAKVEVEGSSQPLQYKPPSAMPGSSKPLPLASPAWLNQDIQAMYAASGPQGNGQGPPGGVQQGGFTPNTVPGQTWTGVGGQGGQ
ncbi:hypothetical protein B0T10DRAFT_459899 [Thelonectria olida]|uniref:Transmembrane protein n=1 Tax=Thelonectria olida TaxID=1576542 RepID=A0A9P9AQ44_9HYPO|nr:hypothetical protein B0T10DRAFT_459899 [Thelonectria olida]